MTAHFKRTALIRAAFFQLLCVMVYAFAQQTGGVALRQIVVASEQEAQGVRASLNAGVSFETLARERSKDSTAAEGGYMGGVRLSDLRSDVRNAIESLKPGEVTGPLRIGNAYVLFQVVPETEGRWIDLIETGTRELSANRWKEAAGAFEKALTYAETSQLGDALLARNLDMLGTAYRLDGRAVDAEKQYRRALEILERIKAPEIEIAQVITGLGTSLVSQERFKEAESFYLRARAIREKRFGPDHAEVAATTYRIAELYAAEGRFAEAAKLYDQSQSALERTLGANHPATLAGAQGRQAFRRALVSELVERASIAASTSQFGDPKSMIDFRELLSLAAPTEDDYLRIKDALLASGLSDEAENVLRAGLKQYSESRILRIYLADVLASTGRTKDALVLLQETSRLPRPDGLSAAADRQQQGIVHQRIADMQAALANLEASLIEYQLALELDPSTPDGRIKLGKAYFSMSKLEEAQSEFERAVRETPNDGDAHLSLAETLLARSQWEKAATAAERAMNLKVSDPRVLYLLGTALVRMGRVDQGRERLQEFGRVEASFAIATVRSREIDGVRIAAADALGAGRSDAAVEQLAQGVSLYPNDDRLRVDLAVIQSRLGRHDKAVETLEAALKLGTDRSFLIHKMLSAENEALGNVDAARSQRRMYREKKAPELTGDAQK